MNDNVAPIPTLHNAPRTLVHTAHILSSGEIIYSLQDFQLVEARFGWVDRKDMIEKIIRLRTRTDAGKKSVLAIYEDGQQIREFYNVEQTFCPLAFC